MKEEKPSDNENVKNRSRDSSSHAVTLHVTDVYKWLEMIVAVEKASLRKAHWGGEEILGPKWVYRGQANSTWSIRSTYERNVLDSVPNVLRNKELILWEKERAALLHFQQWVDISMQDRPSTKGEWLALMQHYGVPTRLVDFTEVPLHALGFALEDDKENGDFAIWMVPCSSPNCGFAEAQRSSQAKKNKRAMLWSDTLAYRVESDEFDRRNLEDLLSNGHNEREAGLLRYLPIGMSGRQKRQKGLFMASTHLSEGFMPLLHKWTRTSPDDFDDAELKIELKDVLKSTSSTVKVWFDQTIANARLIKCVFDKKLRDDTKVLLRCCNITGSTRYGSIEKLAEETKSLMQEGV